MNHLRIFPVAGFDWTVMQMHYYIESDKLEMYNVATVDNARILDSTTSLKFVL